MTSVRRGGMGGVSGSGGLDPLGGYAPAGHAPSHPAGATPQRGSVAGPASPDGTSPRAVSPPHDLCDQTVTASPASAVQRISGAVLLQGSAVHEVAHLVGLGMRYRSQVDGCPPAERHRRLLVELTAASASLSTVSETTKVSLPPSSAEFDVEAVGAADAAHALGLSVQFVRRIAPEMGGWRVGREWRFSRSAVAAEAARRQESGETA